MPKPEDAELLTIEGHTVRVSHPGKLYFSRGVQLTKLDLVKYFLSIAPGALLGIADRPIVLKRFVNGAAAEPFYQKRAPADLPPFLRTATLSFPSGRTAEEVVVDNAAGLAWIVNLGCIELHPHPVRTSDLDHPDQLRIDLDPNPGVGLRLRTPGGARSQSAARRAWPYRLPQDQRVARHPHQRSDLPALELHRGAPRCPGIGSRCRTPRPRPGQLEVVEGRAARRLPRLQPECQGPHYGLRLLGSAASRCPRLRPLDWSEVPDCNPTDFTVATMPSRFERIGDPHSTFANCPCSLDPLLDLAARDESEGLGDAPWPPHFAKGENEPSRVAPSRAKSAGAKTASKPFSQQLGEGFGTQRFRRRLQVAAAPDTGSNEPVGKDGTAEDQANVNAAPAKRPIRSRRSSMPLITIANSPDKAAAEAGLERWKIAYPEAAALLAPDDILTDRMRGSAYVWYRIRLNLRNVPEPLRPAQQTPDPDDDPTR